MNAATMTPAERASRPASAVLADAMTVRLFLPLPTAAAVLEWVRDRYDYQRNHRHLGRYATAFRAKPKVTAIAASEGTAGF